MPMDLKTVLHAENVRQKHKEYVDEPFDMPKEYLSKEYLFQTACLDMLDYLGEKIDREKEDEDAQE